MGQREGIDSSKACPRTPTLERKMFGINSRREMIMAVGLTLMLTSTILVGLQPVPIPAQIILPPPDTDTLIYITSEEINSLEPTRGNPWIVSSFYDTLVSYDRERTDRFRPLLVTEVPSLENGRISPDGLTYCFTIRNDAPLTPEDVEYSIERAMIRGIQSETIGSLREVLLGDDAFESYCDRTGCYDNVTTIDFADINNAVEAEGNDVVFHLAKIYPPFMHVLASSSCSILSKAWCVEYGDWPGTEETWEDYLPPELGFPPFDSPLDSAVQGFGQFMLERLTIADLNPLGYTYPPHIKEMSLVRNEDYWKGPARLERVEIKWIGDWEKRRQMFLEGDADVCSVPEENYIEFTEVEGIRAYTGLPRMSYSGLYFNFVTSNNSPYIGSGELDGNGVPPDFFSDIDIRNAFAYSINYDTIINEIYAGEAQQPPSPLLEGLPFHNPDQESYTYDPDMARQHFQQAWGGKVWNKGFNVTLVYCTPPGLEGTGVPDALDCYRIGGIIKSNIEAINSNFQVNIQHEYYLANLNSTSFYINDYYSQMNVLEILDGFDTFFHGYYDYTVDSGIEAARNTVDPAERQVIYYDLQRIYHEDVPGISIAQPTTRHYQRDWVWGWYYNPAAAGMDFYKMLKGTCQYATRNIIAHVADLIDAGILGAGAGSSLNETLESAIAFMDNASLMEASQVLNDFVDHVNALDLPAWDKGVLIALAQEIIEVLDTNPTPTGGGYDMTMTPLVGVGVAMIVVIALVILRGRIIE
ncbi:MAG: ABC transporter substrate-binding protein [Candidatus Thorarchaeota archaeon]